MTIRRWTVPEDWRGATVLILGGGPSLSEAQFALARAAAVAHRGAVRAIAVNNAVYRAPWADGLYACDRSWWADEMAKPAERERLLAFAGWKATQHIGAVRDHPALRLRWLEMGGPESTGRALERGLSINDLGGFDPRPGFIRSGKNGGYQATHLALQHRPAEIALLGIDMRPRDEVGRTHWHGGHVTAGGRRKAVPEEKTFATMRALWASLAPAAAARGTAIVNCSPGSALDCFPRAELADVLAAAVREAA